jgi:hypothetical protein
MTAREQLQRAYELAFHPALLNAVWNEWERGHVEDLNELRSLVNQALTLHQRLPEAPAVTGRALRRLALYQASSRLYRLPTMLRRFRERLDEHSQIPEEVPAWMVRDIQVPPFARSAKSSVAAGSKLVSNL